ncbi:hypothetical protein QJ854_gp895 [Moumouvirus goulette]|uniref:Uncharacterized protein n=1 Tax=Moumouvirus goulette TaxID=1247379 RepID=M1PVY7_9VIRU|nr:hypothetical protein QJ854_gp895 [Moumouvirus goulette]AGF84887.1 hypothetical protein glt_00078 [Moumouvirus goulette]
MLGNFISQDPDNNFLHYLNHDDNGSKYNLTNQLIALEKVWDVPCGNMYLFTKMYENRIWEIPTNELCEGLIRIFDCLKIKKINELAAGNGFLSARLGYYAKKLDYELEIRTSDGTNKIFGNHPFTFTKVKDFNIRWFNKSEPIIISWIHSHFEDELLSVVEEYKNEYIFLIGQEPDNEDYSNNQSNIFEKKMFSYGYSKITFEFKQVSQMDYYLHDHIRSDIYNENKTCVTFYFHQSKISNVWFVKDLLTRNYPQLFGKYLRKNKEYYYQDKNLLDLSNKKINEYVSNDYQGLNPLLAKGLKNYMDTKKRQNTFRPFQSYPLPSYCDPNSRMKMLASMSLAFSTSLLMEKLMGSPFESGHEFKPIIPKRDITQIVGRCIRSEIPDEQESSNDTTPKVMDKFASRRGKGIIGCLRPFSYDSPMTATAMSTPRDDSLSTHRDLAIELFNTVKWSNKYGEERESLGNGKTYISWSDRQLTSGPLLIFPKTYACHNSYHNLNQKFFDESFGPTTSDLVLKKNHIVPKKLANKTCPLMNKKKFNNKKKFVYKQPNRKSRNH